MYPSYLWIGWKKTVTIPSGHLRRIIRKEFPEAQATELARELGRGESDFRRILTRPNIGLNVMDSVLTGLGIHHLWYKDPFLLSVYEELDRRAFNPKWNEYEKRQKARRECERRRRDGMGPSEKKLDLAKRQEARKEKRRKEKAAA